MENREIEATLSDCGIRPSAIRTLVFKTLVNSNAPLSSQQIETALQSVDRSSISRTMALFAEHDVVHTVDDGSGSMKYEICLTQGSHPDDNRADDRHPHFHCVKCGATICLDSQTIPGVALPDGYVATGVNYVVKGFCPKCQRACSPKS